MLAFRIARVLGLGAALMSAQVARAQEDAAPAKVSFYFVAHEDDWQLFMNPSAFEDVANAKVRTVFIHTTAGDAGLGTGTLGRKHPYFRARENGAETAVRFMADSNDLPIDGSVSATSFNKHDIRRVAYRNTVSYFLRVPDGNPVGSGYESTSFQSLQRLAGGEIATLTAIDGSAMYRGWEDFVATIRAIVDFERGQAPVVQLNVSEVNPRLNPRDHSDHLMTAKAALQATDGLSCARRYYYVDYASARRPANLNAQQREMESSVVAVTAAGILAMDHGSIWQPYFRSYLGRNYFRVENAAGRCGAPPELSAARR